MNAYNAIYASIFKLHETAIKSNRTSFARAVKAARSPLSLFEKELSVAMQREVSRNMPTNYALVYRKIYDFHKRYNGITTDAQWAACADEVSAFKTPFEVDLAVAVVNELERVFERRNCSLAGKETADGQLML